VSIESAVAARLERDGPIRVAVVGAGACARMIVGHLFAGVPSIRLVAIASRTPGRAAAMLADLGAPQAAFADTPADVRAAAARGLVAVTGDPDLLCSAPEIEVIVEVTGSVEYGARVALEAIGHGKHVVLVNAELDSTLGPILKVYADRAGVVVTHTDGEEPGVAMTLLRYVATIGLRPVAAGNLKGMIDRYRTPEAQREFALRHQMDPAKVASFADGTKLSMEATILANATGFGVGTRGMYGPTCAHVRDLAKLLPAERLLNGGLVDYALGAEPYTGAFVVGYEENPRKQRELAYFKMGDGPFYVFYTPYHLPHVQIVSTIVRAALFHDATVTPAGPPMCDVIAVAKRTLNAGEVLDGVGGFMSYGLIENAGTAASGLLLPMGVAEGCRLLRAIPRDRAIGYADVALPVGRLCDRLRAEQQAGGLAGHDNPRISSAVERTLFHSKIQAGSVSA
jgi:predicted homoserine dehydrogenase-like protein